MPPLTRSSKRTRAAKQAKSVSGLPHPVVAAMGSQTSPPRPDDLPTSASAQSPTAVKKAGATVDRSPRGSRRMRWYQGIPEMDKYFKCEWLSSEGDECGAFIKQRDEEVSRHMRTHFGAPPSLDQPSSRIVCQWRGCHGRSSAAPTSVAHTNALRHVRTVHIKMERDTCAKCGITHDRSWALVRHWKKCCKCDGCGVVLEDDVRWEKHVQSCTKVLRASAE